METNCPYLNIFSSSKYLKCSILAYHPFSNLDTSSLFKWNAFSENHISFFTCPTGNGLQKANGLQVSYSRSDTCPLSQHCWAYYCCCHPGHVGVHRVQPGGEHARTQIPKDACMTRGKCYLAIDCLHLNKVTHSSHSESSETPLQLAHFKCDGRHYPDVRVNVGGWSTLWWMVLQMDHVWFV